MIYNPVKCVSGGQIVIQIRNDLFKPSIGSTLGLDHSGHHLSVAFGSLRICISCQNDFHFARRVVEQLAAKSQIIHVINEFGGDFVFDGSVSLSAGERHTSRQIFGQWTGDRSFRLNETIVSIAHFHRASRRKTWESGRDIKGSCGGVFSKKCSLRPS